VKIALHEMEWEGNPQSVDDRQEQALDSQAGFSAHWPDPRELSH